MCSVVDVKGVKHGHLRCVFFISKRESHVHQMQSPKVNSPFALQNKSDINSRLPGKMRGTQCLEVRLRPVFSAEVLKAKSRRCLVAAARSGRRP
jgi:hypothetical protein